MGNGQCFNCDERYVRDHNRVCAKLFHFELDEPDDDDDKTTEGPAEQPRISLIAIAGIHTRGCQCHCSPGFGVDAQLHLRVGGD
jgi:hypothetical protein